MSRNRLLLLAAFAIGMAWAVVIALADWPAWAYVVGAIAIGGLLVSLPIKD